MIALWCLSLHSATAQDICVKARQVLEKINILHVQPRTVNDSLSADIFSEFFRTLDPGFNFFISKDTGALVKYKYQLDDGNQTVCSFIDAAKPHFKRRITWYRNFIDSVLSRPMDLSKPEIGPPVIETASGISKTNRELKSRLLKELKLKVLLAVYRHAAADSNIRLRADAFNKAEPAARQRVRKNELLEIEKLLADEKAFITKVHNSYLKSIPRVFDPHSAFFTKEEMNEFDESLNPSALSFGIKLGESPMGEVTVSNIVPGSPAWNSNQVHKDDVLVGIRWNPSGEYIDLVDLDHEVIEGILNKQGEMSADITIRKTTGEVRVVKLVKEKLENEENIVSGFVLRGKGSKRAIGYISLPGFFSDANPEANGCAVEVTKEIIKLKGESIEGLILDLRFNGGGLLFEAIELAGLFIDIGPVGIVEAVGEAPATIKDANRGLIYDGPLVVMVNGASASASEVVAAALQDHHRAVIAGSPTYGKASGQDVVPLVESNPDEGFLKVTEMRLYRINGQSHQSKGVSPDFPINDLSTVVYRREEQSEYSLPPLSTNKKTYYTPLPSSFDDALKYTIKNGPVAESFAQVKAMQDVLSANVPLERQAFINFMTKLEGISKKLALGTGQQGLYSVSNNKYDATMLQLDSYHTEMNKEIIGQVTSSIYIQEVYRLLDNIITKKK